MKWPILGAVLFASCMEPNNSVKTVIQDCRWKGDRVEILAVRAEGTMDPRWVDGHSKVNYKKCVVVRGTVQPSHPTAQVQWVKVFDCPVSHHSYTFRMLSDVNVLLNVGPFETGKPVKFGTVNVKTGTWTNVGDLPRWYDRYPKLRLEETYAPKASQLCAVVDKGNKVIVWREKFSSYDERNGNLILSTESAIEWMARKDLDQSEGSIVFPDDDPQAAIAAVQDGELLVDGVPVMRMKARKGQVIRLSRNGNKWWCLLEDAQGSALGTYVVASSENEEVARISLPPLYSVFCANLQEGVVVFGYSPMREGDISLRVWWTKTNIVKAVEGIIPEIK